MVDVRVLGGADARSTAEQASKGALGGRARILNVARAAFIERGFADVSMQEIASAAGLTKAAIYYHFSDKEALFESVLIDEIELMGAGIAARLNQDLPLRDQLERVARFALESGRGDVGRLVDDVHRYCADGSIHSVQARVDGLYGVIRAAFARAREAGEIRAVDIDVAVALYLGMIGSQIKGPAMRHVIDVPPEEMARAIAGMVVDGIGVERSSSE